MSGRGAGELCLHHDADGRSRNCGQPRRAKILADWKHCAAWRNWASTSITCRLTANIRPGTVNVELDGKGIARFEIAHPVAWDFLRVDFGLAASGRKGRRGLFWIAGAASQASRETIRHFLRATSRGTVKVFDVNLRQSYYSQEVSRGIDEAGGHRQTQRRGTAEDHEPGQVSAQGRIVVGAAVCSMPTI